MRSYICLYQSIGEKNAANNADLLVVVLVVMMVLVVVAMPLLYSASGKKRKGLDDLFMLLPLNPPGLLRESPRKLTTAY